MTRLLPALFLLFSAVSLTAQYQIGLVPRTSPDRAVYQKIGYTEVEVTYGSPSAANRTIWGELVPYDEVWRAGANNATTVSFSRPVTLHQNPLDSGTYALFVLPKEKDQWTVIFSHKHRQWGSFKYDPADDALRATLTPRRTPWHTEQLTYTIRQLGYQHGSIVLNWGFMELDIPFTTNYLTAFAEEVESRVSQQPDYLQWIVYLQGAEHLYEIGSRPDLATSWINRAEQIMDATTEWNEQFYPRDYIKGHLYWTKAQLLAQADHFAEAVTYVRKLKNLDNPLFYQRQGEAAAMDDLLAEWENQ